jgi:PadR family transcriptional regulator PadR
MMFLATLRRQQLHGYLIAQQFYQESGNVLCAEEGCLYPALQQLLNKGWVFAVWRVSSRNRRVRFYSVTTAGSRIQNMNTHRFLIIWFVFL